MPGCRAVHRALREQAASRSSPGMTEPMIHGGSAKPPRRTRSSSPASGISSRPPTGRCRRPTTSISRIRAGRVRDAGRPQRLRQDHAAQGDRRLHQADRGHASCATAEPVRGPGRERGVVFQELAILPWRTVRRNIGHGLEIAGVPRAERERTVARLIELTGLTGFEDRYPHELSGGMRQRVAVARTWAADPDVILMDEPFAAVDAMTRLTLQEELVRLCAATSKTVFFITHSVDEAVFLGDRVLVMTRRPGRIKARDRRAAGAPRGRDWESFKVDAGDAGRSPSRCCASCARSGARRPFRRRGRRPRRAHERDGGSARAGAGCRHPARLAAAWRQLRGLKILLPFAPLVAVWWAIYASADFSPQVLVSPLAVWRAFVHLVTYGVLAEYASTSLRMIGVAARALAAGRRAARLRGRRQPLCGARARGLPALPAGHFGHRLAAARHHLVRLHPHHHARHRHLHADRADHLQHHDRRARDPGELHAGAALARRRAAAAGAPTSICRARCRASWSGCGSAWATAGAR